MPATGPTILVVMGVAGSGKTTIATRLAARLGWVFEDADDLHPAANIARMRAGTPLTDADRAPWLAAVAAWIDRQLARKQSGIIACSALKRAYRRAIIGDRDDVCVVYLRGDRALLARRMKGRAGHFMPVTLLDSQLATLEEPVPEERAIVVSVDATPDAIVDEIVGRLDHGDPAGALSSTAP